MTENRRQRNDGLRKLCDCARRAWAKCSHPWHFSFKWQGTHHRFSLNKHLGEKIDSKTTAEAEAEKIRTAIREGTFGQPAPVAEMTVRKLADTYMARHVLVEHAATEREYRYALAAICRTILPHPTGEPLALGEWRVTDIVTDTILQFRETRRAQGGGLVGVNRQVRRLRAMLNWAIVAGYIDTTPFKRGTESVVKLWKEPTRSRRLDSDHDELARLLAACPPHLRAVVECALETGMRKGEILSLQWHQVEGLTITSEHAVTWAPRSEIVLPASKTKTKRDRRIPISSRLKGILEMRRFDPAGAPLPLDAHVFGNELGQRVGDVGRSWEATVLKAHGHRPAYTKTKNLTPASRGTLAAINLHLHDLRREAGSRWLEGGVPLHVVRDWLGHTSIAQTSTYLANTVKTQHDAMAEYERRLSGAPAASADGESETGSTLQLLATDSGKGGRKSPLSATTADKTPNETAVGREPTIM